MADLMGWAAVIVALTTTLVAVFAQLNTRRAIKDAAAEASRVAEENKSAMAAQSETLETVSANVDGKLTAVQIIADKFADEILRLSQGGEPTPHGEPSADQPVTLAPAGKPIVAAPERKPTVPSKPLRKKP